MLWVALWARAAHSPFLLLPLPSIGSQHCALCLGSMVGQTPQLSHVSGNCSPLVVVGRTAALNDLPPLSGGRVSLIAHKVTRPLGGLR